MGLQSRKAPWGIRWAIAAAIVLHPACARHRPAISRSLLADRILPPPAAPAVLVAPSSTATTPAESSSGDETNGTESSTEPAEAMPIRDGCWNASGVLPPDPLALDVAIELAYRHRPSLQIASQQINRARGGQAIAFSPFLPSVKGTVRQIGAIEPIQGYTTQTLPTVVGFGPGAQDFSLAELHVQWILWDFGKTLGNYDAAVGHREIAELQLARARQTTAYDVTVAYFQVLFAQATRRVAEEALRRAESHLFVATNMLREGATDPDDVLRAEVQLAETRQQLVAAQTNEMILIASLNRVIGINVSYPTKVIPIEEEPSVPYSLVDCLQSAVDNREEFRVIQRAIANAQSEARSVRGEFLPRISVAGTAANVEGSGINAGGVAIAGINFDMDLFAGGRKLGELRQANADIRIAVARAKEVCDTIAFEVNQAYRLIDDARQRITLAQTAVRHATENARLVDNKFAQGDATPTDVVDAETTLTRAQQSLAQARYDYQTSLAQLTYATGAELPYDTTTIVIENHAAVPEREVPKNDAPQLTPIQPKEGGSP